MALTPRVKKYTDYGYLITNPASENDVRDQMDGAVQEVFDIVEAEVPLKTELGTLASLLTTIKTSAVAAINELFTNKANKAQEAWQTPTLINSWVNFGGGFNTAQYFKDEVGIVHLKGLIKTGTLASAAFVLPVGYRPVLDGYYGTICAGDIASRLVIGSNGNVIPSTGSNAWYSLENITFRAV